MLIAIGSLLGLLGCLAIFFLIPYSKTRKEFKSLREKMVKEAGFDHQVFIKADLADLPNPVKKYFDYCGYLGTPKMVAMKSSCEKVKFRFGRKTNPISIDYTQYNFTQEPARIAYIDSSKLGIPFEGLDSFTGGKGSMKGVLGKLITLFHQTGKAMNKASLVTYLSECLIVPSAALQTFISWEEVDDRHVRATISSFDEQACGIFAFDEKGEMLSFTTDDREAPSADGHSEKVRWTAVFKEYQESDGVLKPTRFQAIWHYDEGDLLYFDAKEVKIEFDPQLSKRTIDEENDADI